MNTPSFPCNKKYTPGLGPQDTDHITGGIMWNGVAVNFLSREFYVDFDNLSIRGITEFRLNRHVLLSEGKLGILEPGK